MIKTFTKDDLIRYLYHETTEKEEQEIKHALLFDAELRTAYSNLCAMKNELDNARLEPSPKTVMNILDYSRSKSAAKHL
jgi:hypothetical protein